MKTQLIGIGAFSPETVLTNEELSHMVDTSDEWIRTRSGILSRHIAGEEESVISMGRAAAEEALRRAGVAAEDVGCIVMCSTSPTQIFPAGACLLQQALNCRKAFAFDLQAACSGLLYALQTARGLLGVMENCRYALVVASEKMSAMVDWTSRDTCVLFGDGACAFLLERNDGLPESFPACELYSDGKFADRLQIPAGGSLKPATSETVANREHFVRMDGRVIFKQAVQCMSESASSLLASSHVRPEEIRFLVPHQANIRIVEALAQNLGMKDRLYVNLQHHGNTCSASIGLALYEMAREGKVKKEDLLLLVTAGAGLTWGAMLLRWPF